MKRRDFIKAGIAGTAAFTLSGLTLPTRRAYAAAVTYNLVAEVGSKTVAVNPTATPPTTTTIPVWQFRDTTTPGAKGPGALRAGIRVNAGDVVTVNLTNNLTRPVGFAIPGLTVTPAAPTAPGATQAYSFTPIQPGSYLFTDSEADLLGRAMGLAGPMVVMPADGSLRLAPGAPLFDRQYTLFLSEIDSRLNIAVAAGGAGTTELANYAPDYYFVNGLSFPATDVDIDTSVKLTLNQQSALRFINGGLHINAMHFHGYHVNVTLRDRGVEAAIVEKDTVGVAVGECVDVMLLVTQVGKYELHNHFLPAVTGNGFYPYGAMIIMDAT